MRIDDLVHPLYNAETVSYDILGSDCTSARWIRLFEKINVSADSSSRDKKIYLGTLPNLHKLHNAKTRHFLTTAVSQSQHA